MGPSLSVVQTVPSRPKKTSAGTLFSAETVGTLEQARHKPLEANRHFAQITAKFSTTLSIMLLLTSVLPTAASCRHCGRCVSRYRIATAR